MTVLSPAALAQLDKPHDIPYSMPKLLIWTVLVSVVGLFFLTVGLAILFKPGPHGGGWLCLIIGVAVLGAVIKRTLPSWQHIGQSAVSISKEGLTFAGQPLIPWSQIQSNTWEGVSSGGVGVAGAIVIETGGRKLKIWSAYFKCSSDEYVHYCELYHAASQQRQG